MDPSCAVMRDRRHAGRTEPPSVGVLYSQTATVPAATAVPGALPARWRRPVHDDETRLDVSEAVTHIAVTCILIRRGHD